MSMTLSGCNYSYRYYSLDAFCSLQKTIGRKSILLYAAAPQIWIDDTSFSDPQGLMNCMNHYGLTIDSLELPSYGYRLGYSDQAMHAVSMNYFKNGVDFCARINVNSLLIGTDPVFLEDGELNRHIYQESFNELEKYAINKGVRLIVKCSDDSINAVMQLLRVSESCQDYAFDTIDQKRSLSSIFSLYGPPEIILLREPVYNIEHNLEALKQLQFSRSVVVYQVHKPLPYFSCPPNKSIPFHFDLLLQNNI